LHSFFPKILRFTAVSFLVIGILCLVSLFIFLLLLPSILAIGILLVVTPIVVTLGLIFAIWSYIWNNIAAKKQRSSAKL